MKALSEYTEEERNHAVEVAKTIVSQIIATIGKSAYWSWGVEKSTATYTAHEAPAIIMHVNGRQYTGPVVVELNESRDLYCVYTIRNNEAHFEEVCFCDQLGPFLDKLIEVGDDPEEYEAFCSNPNAVFADAFKKAEEHGKREGK